MKVKIFVAHGGIEEMETAINAFLATLASAPLGTVLAVDEHRVCVLVEYEDTPAATTEPVGTSDPTAAPPPTTPPPAPSDAPATSATDTPASV